MKIVETGIPGVLVLEPKVFEDARGFFLETFNRDRYAEVGIRGEFVQDNHSRSCRGTLRGLHYQLRHPQAKLCRVVQGEVLDVAVDIRRGSPDFGRWVAVRLSAENRRQIYIPHGFAHGFLVLSETADFLYKCDDYYDAADDSGVAWNDPEIAVRWGIEEEPILSAKDARNSLLADVPVDRLPTYGDTIGLDL